MVPNILGGGYMDVFLTWIPGRAGNDKERGKDDREERERI